MCPVSSVRLVRLYLYSLPCSVREWAPQEERDLGQGGSLQSRLTLKEPLAGGCLATTPLLGRKSFLEGRAECHVSTSTTVHKTLYPKVLTHI